MERIEGLSNKANCEKRMSESKREITLPIFTAVCFPDNWGRIFFRKSTEKEMKTGNNYSEMDLDCIYMEHEKWINGRANTYLDTRPIFQKSRNENLPLDAISDALYFEIRILLDLPRNSTDQYIIKILSSHLIKKGKINGNQKEAKELLASFNIVD